jgi:hypothetical protein
MRLIVCVLLIFAVGCAKDKPTSDVSVDGTAALIADHCTLNSTGAHAFLEWGTLNANTYDCTVYDKMNCQLSVATDNSHSEFLCQLIDNNAPTTTTCELVNSQSDGYSRIFLDGTGARASSYDCGVAYGLKCHFYSHTPDGYLNSNRQDVVCLDTGF